MIDSFIGEYRFLSNFYGSPIMVDGKMYETVEHAFQAAKTLDPGEKEHVRYRWSALAARKAGQEVTLREDWEYLKRDIMFELVYEKFFCNELLQNALLATGDAKLVEGNHWGDHYWGVCRGVGENHLGEILMEVRQLLEGR